MKLVENVSLTLTVELGSASILVKDLLTTKQNDIIALNTEPGELLKILINGKHIANGEVVKTNEEKYGIRFVEIVDKTF